MKPAATTTATSSSSSSSSDHAEKAAATTGSEDLQQRRQTVGRIISMLRHQSSIANFGGRYGTIEDVDDAQYETRLERQSRRRRQTTQLSLDLNADVVGNEQMLAELNSRRSVESDRIEKQRLRVLAESKRADLARARQQRQQRKEEERLKYQLCQKAVDAFVESSEAPKGFEAKRKFTGAITSEQGQRLLRQIQKFKEVDIYPHFEELPQVSFKDTLASESIIVPLMTATPLPLRLHVSSYSKSTRTRFLQELAHEGAYGFASGSDSGGRGGRDDLLSETFKNPHSAMLRVKTAGLAIRQLKKQGLNRRERISKVQPLSLSRQAKAALAADRFKKKLRGGRMAMNVATAASSIIEEEGDNENDEEDDAIVPVEATIKAVLETVNQLNPKLMKLLDKKFPVVRLPTHHFETLKTLIPPASVRELRTRIGPEQKRAASLVAVARSSARLKVAGKLLVGNARRRLNWRRKQAEEAGIKQKEREEAEEKMRLEEETEDEAEREAEEERIRKEEENADLSVPGEDVFAGVSIGVDSHHGIHDASDRSTHDSGWTGSCGKILKKKKRHSLVPEGTTKKLKVAQKTKTYIEQISERFDLDRYQAEFETSLPLRDRFWKVCECLRMNHDSRDRFWDRYVGMYRSKKSKEKLEESPALHRTVELWELTTCWIMLREDLLVELCLFESVGSHPWRLFFGKSSARLDEEQVRKLLHSMLDNATERITQLLYEDSLIRHISFQGEVYRLKMESDIETVAKDLSDVGKIPGQDAESSMVMQAKSVFKRVGMSLASIKRHQQTSTLMTALPALANPFHEQIKHDQYLVRPEQQSLHAPSTAVFTIGPSLFSGINTTPSKSSSGTQLPKLILPVEAPGTTKLQEKLSIITGCSLVSRMPFESAELPSVQQTTTDR